MFSKAALVLLATLIATPALAHGHRQSHHWRHHSYARMALAPIQISAERPKDCYGIPWCGCYMRHLLGVASKAFNLAREWAHYGHATVAKVGAIVVWPHHVGKIVGGSPGRWVVLSGNDGHRVRERARSVAGAIAFRE